MKYESLKTLYHKLSREEYEAEAARRLSGGQTVHFPIEIVSLKSETGSMAFLVNDWKISRLMEDISNTASAIAKNYAALPPIAFQYYTQRCLIDEIQDTNDIEGIHSTRREITETIDAVSSNAALQKLRFAGMVKKYDMLLNGGGDIELRTGADIRKLYDDVVLDEIEQEKRPDGLLFRTGEVYVVSKTGQPRHRGVMPEARINECMEQSLRVLDDEELPFVVRIAVFHYLFGYIHPFYDGNGRLNRFISSNLLLKLYNPLIALNLSRTIKENRNSYYKAFQTCNDRLNRGDITPFVIEFLGFVASAAQAVNRQLTEGAARLAFYGARFVSLRPALAAHAPNDVDNKLSILMLFVQKTLFGDGELTVRDIVEASPLSKNTIAKLLKSMVEDDGLPISVAESRPKRYSVELDALDDRLFGE